MHKNSDHSRTAKTSEFVNLTAVGLRRSKRLKGYNTVHYGFLVTTNILKYSVGEYTTSTYSFFLEGYDDYLDLNFDETSNSMNILG